MGKRLRRYALVFVLGALALGLVPAAGFGQTTFANLDPGGRAELNEDVPVNFVFVGYDRNDVDEARFRSALPEDYKPVVRSEYFYNESVEESLLGLDYSYLHNVTYAGAAYEEELFGYLSRQADPAPLTDFQKLYNGNQRRFCDPPDGEPQPCQEEGVRDIKRNFRISASSVEKWLVENPPDGVDTQRNTVFFINWWGDGREPREGFKHHVYTKGNEPDPDTDFNFGSTDSRKLIAWGGTTAEDEENGLDETNRVWFHDLSAGPDSFTDNWNVDDPDLTGDRVEDYRMPPIWEYFTPGGYRQASRLTGDLAKISRYVAIDLFFTSSPLYPPEFTPELLPEEINLDVNTVEGIPNRNSSERYQTESLVLDEVSEVHRLTYTIDQQDITYAGKAKSCYVRWVRDLPCYAEEYPGYPAVANLFLYGAENLGAILDDEPAERQYEAVLLNWAVEDGEEGRTSPPVLGYADDNYRDGTQSFVYNFVSPGIARAGYGLTTTEIHEYGHHLNLSHPFDGFDYETETDYGWDGEFYFTGVGNEINSMMSYVDVNWDFSQFDRDNTDRFQAAAYINNANALAQEIAASPNDEEAAEELAQADIEYGEAKDALRVHDYAGTFENAREAYEQVLAGANDAGVTVEESENGRTADPDFEASSEIPGRYIDRPEPRDPVQPLRTQGAEDIEAGQPQDFSPTAHRLRR